MAKASDTPAPDPDSDPLAKLGAARRRWDSFLASIATKTPEAAIAWKHYAGKSGVQCVVRMNARNLAYLKPGDGHFLVSFALSEAAVASLPDAGLPAALVEEVAASPRYPEGRPARVRVDSASSLRDATTLFAIKAADCRRT